MAPLLAWIVVFCALGGALSVLAAGAFLLLPERLRTRLLPSFVSFAVGALLGASFLGLLPEALEARGVDGATEIGVTVLLGIVGFFLLEKMMLWRHSHACDYEAHVRDLERARRMSAGSLILVGDGIHNMVDGVLIAAAFLADVRLGIVTSVAVIAHEIPQEVGDFAVLLHSGYSPGRALTYNVLASLTTIIGGMAAYFSLSLAQSIVPYVLAIAASSFIYIAVADLIPGLHRRPELSATVQQLALMTIGAGATSAADFALH